MLYQLSYLATKTIPLCITATPPAVNTAHRKSAARRAAARTPAGAFRLRATAADFMLRAMSTPCPFCALPPARILASDGPCIAFRDAFPVSDGHTLIIPRRHVASFRDLTPDEWAAALRLAQQLATELQQADPTCAGFNFGANDGHVAGQSVFHCHFHLIPRRVGDHPNPRGGIRGVIPHKADYPCPHR